MIRHAIPHVLLGLLMGCASYAPAPLTERPAVLAPPVAEILARETGSLDQPWLPPMTVDLTQPLDPSAIAVLAVVANPDLKAARERAGVSDAQVFAAGLLPDPTFSLGASKVLSGPDTFLDLASALGLDLNALRVRGAVRANASAQARQVRLDLAWNEWQTAGLAQIQAARIIALERIIAIARQSESGTRSLLDRTLRAAGRGDLPADQAQGARVGAYDAAERLRLAERDLAAARLELLKLLGLPPTTQLKLAPAALPPPPPDAAALFAIATARRADLAALRAGYEAQEAVVRKAILDQFPTMNLTVNPQRDSAGNTKIGPSIDFTLPLWNRNRGGIAIERATRAALRAEYEARLFQTRAEIAAAVTALSVTRRQMDTAITDLPALQRFADATARAAGRGDLAPATAQTAAQALRDRETLIAQDRQALAEQAIALELLTGAPREWWTQ